MICKCWNHMLWFSNHKRRSLAFIVSSTLFFIEASTIQCLASMDPTIHTNHPCLDPWWQTYVFMPTTYWLLTSSRRKSLWNNHTRLIISKTGVIKFYCFTGKPISKVIVSICTTPSSSLLPPYHSEVFLMLMRKMFNSRKLVSIKTTNNNK